MKVLLVDDHPLFLEGLQYLLETYGIDVIGLATNGKDALEKAQLLKPDIILMDIKMPDCSGLDALIMIKAEMPDIKIIMLTTSDEDSDLFDAIKFGASGYFLKNTNAKELVDMLSNIESNETSLSPGMATKLLGEFRSSDSISGKQDNSFSQHVVEDKKAEQLTRRQFEVLELVAKGITYKEVGVILGLTERTVKYHMEKILELLHLENRAQMIAYATRMRFKNDE